MTIEGEALLVRIYIGESDHVDGKPAYDVIVKLLRERGIRGASVFRGIEGFGRSSRVHTTRILPCRRTCRSSSRRSTRPRASGRCSRTSSDSWAAGW